MAQFQLPTGETVLIDDTDAAWVSEFPWRARKSHQKLYVIAWVLVDGRKTCLRLHRCVLGVLDPSIFVDHKSGDTFDNRRANLRSCTHTQNIRNQVRTQPSKSSKYKGVMWSPRYEKWTGQIKADGKKYYLGVFNNEESAARAYNAAAMRLHGEFASLNSLS
jgi:hypothetical protein